MEPIIREFQTCFLIGFPAVIKDNMQDIGAHWDLLLEHQDKIKNINGPCIGLEFYPWDFGSTGKFYYMPGFMVSDLQYIPDNMCGKIIRGGKFAVWTHHGEAKNLHATFQKIYREWLPASSVKMSRSYDFEFYGEGFKGACNPESEIEIWIPID